MRYYKDINNGYILAIGIGGGGTEITETEYNAIMAVIQQKPAWENNTDYHLKTDLTWESYERIPVEPSDEIDPDEALEILTGGAE
jgi:hypothetical protein